MGLLPAEAATGRLNPSRGECQHTNAKSFSLKQLRFSPYSAGGEDIGDSAPRPAEWVPGLKASSATA